jgi:hypothetical protein
VKIRVECYAGHRGDETPRRIVFDARSVEVAEVLDQATYILRQDMPTQAWEMTMYEKAAVAGERRS